MKAQAGEDAMPNQDSWGSFWHGLPRRHSPLPPRVTGHGFRLSVTATLAVLVTVLTAVTAPGAQAQCRAPAEWFPHANTPEPDFHAPATDCEFHQWGYQTFLWLTQPTGPGRIRLLDLPTAAELFLPGKGPDTLDAAMLQRLRQQPLVLTPRVPKLSTPAQIDDLHQAGLRGMLVDQNGRAVYYATHVSPAYYQFVRSNRLFLRDSYLKAAPTTNFPVRAVTVKSSWRVVAPGEKMDDAFTTSAVLYPLACRNGGDRCQGGDIVIDFDRSRARTVQVALAGVHVVGVVEDHPEFVWSTFEHRTNAPDLPTTMASNDPDPVSDRAWTFYAAKTPAKHCNVPNATTVTLDVRTQRLSPISHVFRQFAGGGGDSGDRATIASLNRSVQAQLDPASVWRNYFLVGSVWFGRANDLAPGLGGPYIQRRVVGSVRVSNSTMETQTQLGRRNCFACHDTAEHGQHGIPAMNMNVSHILLDGLVRRHDLARLPVKRPDGPDGPLQSYAAVRDLLNDFVTRNAVPIGSTLHGPFWNRMTYKEFTEGAIPGFVDGAGKPLNVLVTGNARESNLVLALRGAAGTAFDPVDGRLGRMPTTGPFLHEKDIDRIADWIDRGCPDQPGKGQ